MDSNGAMVVATCRGEYGGIWYQKGDVFAIAHHGDLARWMAPADPTDSRWNVPAVDELPAPADAGASDTARLSRIEGKLDYIIGKIQDGESGRKTPPADLPPST